MTYVRASPGIGETDLGGERLVACHLGRLERTAPRALTELGDELPEARVGERRRDLAGHHHLSARGIGEDGLGD